jgi:hypothetical protein
VLLASFLQNQQQEKANKSFRLVHDLFNGKGNSSLLTKNLELSLSELKDAQLDNLRDLWHHTVYPSLTIADFIKYHNAYTEDLIDLENKRLQACANYIKEEKRKHGAIP